ncbi:MAG: universal stress protein [Chloroflexi bacterium]|nr:universal stress protein [Chloroflexota bacterium]
MKTRLTKQVKRIFETAPPRKPAPSYLVNYDGGPASVAALREACDMASAGTKVVAVFLDQIPEGVAAEGREMLANAILASAIVNARLYGVNIETRHIPCGVKGPTLVTLAAEQESAVLFLGVDDRELDAQLNPFADYVLSLAPCQVVLVGV